MNEPDKNLTTGTLEDALIQVNDRKALDTFLKKADASAHYNSFIEYFRSIPRGRALSDAELQKKSDIERSYCYHVLSGSKAPGRDKILRLCLAAGLDLSETKRALEAGKAAPLYAKNRRDAVISFAVGQHLSVIDTNLLLSDYHLDPLG